MYKNTKFICFIALICILSLYSCNSKKIGFFQNKYENYRVIKPTAPATNHEVYVLNTDEEKSDAENSFTETIVPLKTEYKNAIRNTTLPKRSLTNESGNLTKEKRKQIKKDIKSAVKNINQNATEVSTVLLVIFAILLPPLAVALVDGITGPFWLSILLTLLFYLPGIIYAFYRIYRKS